jgi:hypothetical protein
VRIKTDLREIGWGVLGWVDVAKDKDQWSAIVKGNETLGSVKCWEILEQLSDWRLLKDSALWNYKNFIISRKRP